MKHRWGSRASLAGVAVVVAAGALVQGAPVQAADERTPRCAAGQLAGAVVVQGAALGSRFARLVVTNQGGDCTLYGYGGLHLVAADGRLLPTRVEEEPFLNDGAPAEPSLITLRRAGSATADVRWRVGPCGTAGDDGTPASRPAALTVVPPGGSSGFTVPWAHGAVCGEVDGPAQLRISPFRPS